jgi:hypothetical protein
LFFFVCFPLSASSSVPFSADSACKTHMSATFGFELVDYVNETEKSSTLGVFFLGSSSEAEI